MNEETIVVNNENPTPAEGTPAEENKTSYSAEEVMALLQKETDRRVNQALSKQKKDYEKKLSLSKLDGDERAKAEKDNRIAELEEQLAQFQIEKNRSELKTVLSSRGLSAEFADIVTIGDDIEEAQANIDRLDKLFKAAVRAEVEKRLAGSIPKGTGAASSGELTKEQAQKMGIVERQALKDSNPELYKKLFN